MQKLVLSSSLILLGFIMGYFLRETTDEFWDRDRCLDLGGAWDYERYNCRYE